MAKPIITRINLTKETMDEENRLVRTYKVEGTNLNVHNVKTAYTASGNRLPQKGEKDPYTDVGRAALVTKINATQSGKFDASGSSPGVIDVTVTYAPVDEFNASEKEKTFPGASGGGSGGSFNYPWDEPTEFNLDGDSIEVDMWGMDEKDQALAYSNGEPVNLTQPMPLSVMTFQRNVKVGDAADSFDLSAAYYQRVNNAPVSITIFNKTYNFGARTLLVAGYPVSLNRYKKIDPLTGVGVSIPYYTENIQLVYRANTWATRIPDQGHQVIDANNKVVSPRNANDKTRVREVLLNGAGKQLLDDTVTGALRDPLNAPATGTTPAPYNVTIDDTATAALNNRMVILAFLTYEEVDFTSLDLSRGLNR